jgi:hypothetical protein
VDFCELSRVLTLDGREVARHIEINPPFSPRYVAGSGHNGNCHSYGNDRSHRDASFAA